MPNRLSIGNYLTIVQINTNSGSGLVVIAEDKRSSGTGFSLWNRISFVADAIPGRYQFENCIGVDRIIFEIAQNKNRIDSIK